MPQSVGTVTAKIAVQHKIAIGPTTVLGGGVTVAALVTAVVAFIQGARDEETISALVVGVVGLVSVLGGRYAQAVAATLALKAPAAAPSEIPTDTPMGSVAAVALAKPAARTRARPRAKKAA